LVRKVEIEERARWHRGLVGEGLGIGYVCLAIQILRMCLCKINQQKIQLVARSGTAYVSCGQCADAVGGWQLM